MIFSGGKSFSIRLKSKDSSVLAVGEAESKGGDAMDEHQDFSCLSYVHVPINAPATTTKQLISRMEEATQAQPILLCSRGMLLHLDISSTCDSSLVGQLFSLLVLGALRDVQSTSAFSFNASTTRICIELACGQEKKSFSHFQVYGHVETSVSSLSLCLSREDLLCGMGDEEFYARIGFVVNDSGATSPGGTGGIAVTAYDRLQYVLLALSVQAEKNGAFPFDFSAIEYFDHHFDSPDAFELLTSACCGFKVRDDDSSWKPSYWSLWNFVNMLFVQFQEVQDVNSPISLSH